MGLFLATAPKYWTKGLPVIPLIEANKMPAIARWQMAGIAMPTEHEQAMWLRMYPNGNMGLPLGPASGLVMIDIDTTDQKIVAILERVLPPSPWERIGKKGKVLVYRYKEHRAFKIRHAREGMIVELLSKGQQAVLPPSIHPDTKKPYVANCDLLDALDRIPTLQPDIEAIIRGALTAEGVEITAMGGLKVADFVAAGARDNALTQHAGILSRAITRGERTLVEALGEISHWCESFTEKVAGDNMDPGKARAKVVEFLTRDVMGEKGRSLPTGWDAGLEAEDKEALGLNVLGESHERWSSARVVEYLAAEFGKHIDPGSEGFITAVNVALGSLARNPDIDRIMEQRILAFINDSSRKTLPLTVLRKRLADFRHGELQGNDHTEIAKAALVDLQKNGEVRYHAERFWQWRGASWEEMDVQLIAKFIAEEYGSLPLAKRISDHTQIIKGMSNLCKMDLKQVSLHGMNFANGYLTDNLQLLPHNPDHGCQYVLPYRYIPEDAGRAPMFMQFLHDCWGRDADFQDKVQALQEAMAATMFGMGARFQRAFCLFGEARTGKSRLVETMRGLLPTRCACAVPPHAWHDRWMPTELFGKLVNMCGELSETELIRGDRFKLIVEGSEIQGEFKNKPVFMFRPTCAHWFATNHLPKTRDTSDGFNRRWLYLEFNHVVPGDKMVVDIDKIILSEEREAIAAWAAQGITRLKEQQDYTASASHLALVDQVANENNSVRYFLSASPLLRIGRAAHNRKSETSITEAKLHHEYWLFSNGIVGAKPVGVRQFHKLMKQLQRTFGFEQSIERNGRHGQETVYEWITLADVKLA